jgi:CDP-diacylglycerol--glycerol-3-phosphate 3-phosphatidyltransferase
MADSFYHLTVFICFAVKGYAPVWMVALLFYRDFMVSYLRTLGSMHGEVLSARGIGKRKTMSQGLAIMIILLLDIVRHFRPIEWFHTVSYILVGIATLVTVVAGVTYLIVNRKLLRKLELN